jgi:nucleotide-binding universal stress UspA family protein
MPRPTQPAQHSSIDDNAGTDEEATVGTIVVGVDGSAGARRALDFAAGEGAGFDEMRNAAEAQLAEQAESTRRRTGLHGVVTDAETLEGAPVAVLRETSRDGELLVVGTREVCDPTRVLLASRRLGSEAA